MDNRDYIEKYLNLYYIHIKPQTAQRQQIADDLRDIVKDIKKAMDSNSSDIPLLFRTISLRK